MEVTSTQLYNELVEVNSNLEMLNDTLDTNFNNLFSGIQIILAIMGAFLFWKVITVIYKLFGGIFFGGV